MCLVRRQQRGAGGGAGAGRGRGGRAAAGAQQGLPGASRRAAAPRAPAARALRQLLHRGQDLRVSTTRYCSGSCTTAVAS